MQTIKPQDKHFDPVGTLEELSAQNMDVGYFGACAEREGKVLGCPYWDDCEMSYKGKAGPRNHGIRIIKSVQNGSGVREVVLPCYGYLNQNRTWKENGTIARIVASEAGVAPEGARTKIMVRGSRPDLKRPEPKGGHAMVPFMEEVEVAPFPRPGENPDLIAVAYAAKMTESERRLEEDRTYNAVMGTPLTEGADLRHVWTGQGSASQPDEGRLEEGNPERRGPGRPRKQVDGADRG